MNIYLTTEINQFEITTQEEIILIIIADDEQEVRKVYPYKRWNMNTLTWKESTEHVKVQIIGSSNGILPKGIVNKPSLNKV